jgi:hypothetical protein
MCRRKPADGVWRSGGVAARISLLPWLIRPIRKPRNIFAKAEFRAVGAKL